MIDLVDETLAFWRQQPFVWGEYDCMLSIGDYIAKRGGLDVTGEFRGTYNGPTGAIRHIKRVGGIPALIDLTGIERIEGKPARGDVIALAAEDCEGGMIGAICTGPGIAARTVQGVWEVNARLVHFTGVWRCPY